MSADFIYDIISSPFKLVGSLFNEFNKPQQDYNSAEAQKQRDFEERMSSTSYQRSMQDLENSGLNAAAVLSNGGSPASTPSGSSASTEVNGASSILSLIPALISSSAGLASVVNTGKELANKQMVRSANQILNETSSAVSNALRTAKTRNYELKNSIIQHNLSRLNRH